MKKKNVESVKKTLDFSEDYVKKKTKEFVAKALLVHGTRYTYNNVVYVNSKTKVCVTCPLHGDFFVRPDIHLQGCICKKCQLENQKRIIFGKGYNDLLEESHTQAYKIWKHMLSRCYSEVFKKKQPTYIDCEAADEWLLFSNFKRWFDEHYVDGWHLDKDILVKGNKVYSPETCCFVPQEINGLFAKSNKKRGMCCIGVTRHGNGFRALMMAHGQHERLGTYKTEVEAFEAYKRRKEEFIKETAELYKDLLESRVYEALYNYQVEITD